MKCPNCNAIIPDDIDICPACFAQVQTAQEPVTPPCTSAPVAHPSEVENQSEASWKTQEGHRQAPPRENTVRGNVEGRFSRTSSKKGLFLGIGILLLLIIAGIGYMALVNRQATVPAPPPATQEKPAEEKPAEQAPETQTPAPETQAEAKPEQQTLKASPTPKKKVVRKAPAKAPKVSPVPAPERKAWTYRPDPDPAKPAPKPQAQKNGIAGWLDKALGPEKPVTPPPPVNDSRGTGM